MQPNHNDLSVAGREIIQSNTSHIIGDKNDLEKITLDAKHDSRYPRGQNGLLFAFLRDELIEALNEKNQWKVSVNIFFHSLRLMSYRNEQMPSKLLKVN